MNNEEQDFEFIHDKPEDKKDFEFLSDELSDFFEEIME